MSDLINDKIEVTSFEAWNVFQEFDKEFEKFRSYPPEMLDVGKQQRLAQAMMRVIYDSDARHLARAVSAKGFIPYFTPAHRLSYAQNIGFEKQETKLDQISIEGLAEGLVSNMYAAMDHIYWVIGEMRGEALALLQDRGHPPTMNSLESMLALAENYSSKILYLEKEVLADERVKPAIQQMIGENFDYSQPVADRSWRNNPHWDNFDEHFRSQKARVDAAASQIGPECLGKYKSLSIVLHRLDHYAAK